MLGGCHRRSVWNYTATTRFRDLLRSWEPPAAEQAAARRTCVLNRLNRLIDQFPPPSAWPLLEIRGRQ